jgi:hypothetical protein
MAFNGSGVFSLVTGNPVVSGAVISSTVHNNTMTDIATNGLTNCITKTGETPATANLPMGNFRHTGVGAAAALTDYAQAKQVIDGEHTSLGSVSGTDTITAAGPLSFAAYVAGQNFNFIAAGNNTGATTININSIGAKAITKSGTTALVSGDIKTGQVIPIVYDGTRFQIIGGGGTSVVTTRGDVIRGSSGGVEERLALGASGQALVSDGTDLVYGSAGGPSKGANALIRTNATNIDESITLSDHSTTFTADASANTINNKGSANGFANGDTVQLTGSDLPNGWVAGTQYYVITVASGSMQLALTFGGSAVTISDAGSGTNTVYQNINGMTAGPITIDSGTTEIPSGSTWSII